MEAALIEPLIRPKSPQLRTALRSYRRAHPGARHDDPRGQRRRQLTTNRARRSSRATPRARTASGCPARSSAPRRRRASPRDLDLLVVASRARRIHRLRIGLAAMQGLAMVLGHSGRRRLGARCAGAAPHRRVDAGATRTSSPPGWTRSAARCSRRDTRDSHEVAPGDAGWRRDRRRSRVVPRGGGSSGRRRDAVAFAGDGAVRYRDRIARADTGGVIVDAASALAPLLAGIGRRLAAPGRPARRTRCSRCMSGGRTRSCTLNRPERVHSLRTAS